MKKTGFLLFYFVSVFTKAQSPIDPLDPTNPLGQDQNWNLQWSANFKSGGLSLSSYTSNGWEIADDFDRGEPQVNRANNVSIVNGTGLIITAKAEDSYCSNCSNGGVFSTANNGVSWSNADGNGAYTTAMGLCISQNISAFAINGTNLFAATGDAGVYRSTLGTSTWYSANPSVASIGSPPKELFVTALLAGSGNLFKATRSGGIFLSTDNGATWTNTSSGLPLNGSNYQNISTLYTYTSGGTTFLFAGTNAGVYVSTNSGTSWSAASSGLPSSPVISLCYYLSGSTNYLFAGIQNGAVYLSTNNGSSWSSVSTSLPGSAVLSIHTYISGSTNYLYAGTDGNGVYQSTNAGTSWTTVSSGLPSGSSISCFTSYLSGSTRYLYAGTKANGVYLSTNNGSSWSAAATITVGPDSTSVYTISAMIANGTELIAGVPGWFKPHHNYTSGSISTSVYGSSNYDHMPEYGYIEAVIKAPDREGSFPAYWFWSSVGVVNDNSIEAFELVPGAKVTCSNSRYYDTVYDKNYMTNNLVFLQDPSTVQCIDYNLGVQVHYINDYTTAHKYGVEWSPSKIIYYVDGVAIRTTTNTDPLGNRMVTGSKHIILNLALYDWWKASINGDNADYKYNFYTDIPKYFPTAGTSSQLIMEYINYYTLDYTDCSTNMNINNVTDLNSYVIPKHDIIIDGLGTNFNATTTSPNSLRASDYIQINKDFTVPSGVELYLDANVCP